jgi:hypothetical protein
MAEQMPGPMSGSLTNEEIEFARNRVRIFRLLVAALAAGVLVFAIFAVIFRGNLAFNFPPPFLSLVLGGISIVVGIQSILIPILARSRIAAEPNTSRANRMDKLCSMWLGTGIAGMALMESAAILNLVAVLLEGNLTNLVLAGLGLAGMIAQFPTLNRLLDWLEPRLGR